MRAVTLVTSLGVIGCVVVLAIPSGAYQAGPPPGVTGGFGEETCQGCHSTFALNEGRTSGAGDLVVSGLPERYEPGKAYRVTVSVNHKDGREAWGFQFTTRAKDGAQAGTLEPIDGNTQILARNNVQYVEHTPEGTFSNIFAFDWTAPDGAPGDVVVNIAGNAANGDADTGGDYIYSASVMIPVASH